MATVELYARYKCGEEPTGDLLVFTNKFSHTIIRDFLDLHDHRLFEKIEPNAIMSLGFIFKKDLLQQLCNDLHDISHEIVSNPSSWQSDISDKYDYIENWTRDELLQEVYEASEWLDTVCKRSKYTSFVLYDSIIHYDRP